MKTRKYPYLAHFGLKWKNKTTLFCQTFKVEEKKVVLFFNFELNQARYGHFLVFDIFALMSPFVKFEPPCGTPKSVPIWLKIFLVYILMYWNGINNLLSTFETLFEIWSTLVSYHIVSYLILLYRILSFLSYRICAFIIVSCLVSSYLFLPCLVLACLGMPWMI